MTMTYPSKPHREVYPALARRTGTGIEHQRGSTLLVGLIMLVLLTLVAVSAINSTSSSVQMVGNAQFREEATAAAQKAIENVISNGTFRTTPPAPQTISVNGAAGAAGAANYTVTFSPAPSCISFKPVAPSDPDTPPACASSIGAVCFWTLWDIRAVVTDPNTGASVAIHQGVRTIAGLNAGVTACGIGGAAPPP